MVKALPVRVSEELYRTISEEYSIPYDIVKSVVEYQFMAMIDAMKVNSTIRFPKIGWFEFNFEKIVKSSELFDKKGSSHIRIKILKSIYGEPY